MTKDDSIELYNTLAATFASGQVSLSVEISDNVIITTTGIRTSTMVSRAASRGGLADNIDFGVYVLKSVFAGHDIASLRGRTATVSFESEEAVRHRIVSTREHPLGGVIILQFGEYDRVVP